MYRNLLAALAAWLLSSVSSAQHTADTCFTALTVTDGTHLFDTTGATESGVLAEGLPPYAPGMPNTGCEDLNGEPDDLHRDVFLKWTAQDTDSYTLSICSTATYDTKIALYSFSCAFPAPIACNDDFAGCTNFTTTLNATGIVAGVTYYVQIGGFDNLAAGSGSLNISADNGGVGPPPGDTCADAVSLPDGPGVIGFDTSTYTMSGVNPGCGGSDPGDLWYEWAPDVPGTWIVSTCDMASFDTRLAAWSACGGNLILCNDDDPSCAGFTSTLVLLGQSPSTSIFLQVGGFNFGVGTGALEIELDTSSIMCNASTYCVLVPNSVGPGASISIQGTTEVSANDLVLIVSGAPANQFGVFYYGPLQINVGFGEGRRCVGGKTNRLWPPLQSDASGAFARATDYTAVPMNGGTGHVFSGAVLNFQLWYRDPPGGPFGFNLSSAIELTFCP
jgi:hypothetical protein